MFCGKAAHLALLAVIEVIAGIAQPRSRFHFDGDSFLADGNNEIDLAATNTDIACEDGGAPISQEPSRNGLP